MIVSPTMGLTIWNLPTDPFDSQQLADNIARIDQHDHSLGKGASISSAGLTDGSVNQAKIAPEAVGLGNLGTDVLSYISVKPVTAWSGGIINAPGVSQWSLGDTAYATSSGSNLRSETIFHWDPSAWSPGDSTLSLSWRLSTVLATNGGTVSLPTSRFFVVGVSNIFGVSGAPNTYGQLAASEHVSTAITGIVADRPLTLVRSTFEPAPTAGFYSILFESTGMGSGAIWDVRAQLEMGLV